MMKIKAPATTANIGPGFDCLGIALNKFLEVDVYKNNSKIEFNWLNNTKEVPEDKNLILKTIKSILKKNNYEKGYKINVIKNDIPISRGLGSSASAIVAGVYAANYLLDNKFSKDELLKIACNIEGHPDNVAPCILGDMVMSKKIKNEYLTSKIDFPEELEFVVLIPDFEVSTEEARNILPDNYNKEDVLTTISNLSFLINSLNQKENLNHLRYFLDDKVHQPYRIELINNGKDIFNKSMELESIGEFISGSGPTLICIIDKNNNDFVLNMKNYLESLEDKWTIEKIKVNKSGVNIEVK